MIAIGYSLILLLVVTAVIFLAFLGKYGWTSVMKGCALTVAGLTPIALYVALRIDGAPRSEFGFEQAPLLLSPFGVLVFAVGSVIFVVFLALLGKHGWTPVLKGLLVVAILPFAVYLLAPAPRLRSPSPGETGVLLMGEQQGQEQSLNGTGLNVTGTGEVRSRGAGHPGIAPVRGQLVPDRAPSFFYEAQVRPRGRVSVVAILFLAAAGFVIAYRVRSGAWSLAGVSKVAGLGVVGLVILMSVYSVRERRSYREVQEANGVVAEQSVVLREEKLLSQRAGQQQAAEHSATEAVREGLVERSEAATEPMRLGDVETWRRESVLGFKPHSPSEQPAWCREGLDTEPRRVRLSGTTLLSSLPEGRDWLVGYSSQQTDIPVAQREAWATASRKLALEALINVQEAVPELDVLPFQELAQRVVERYVPVQRYDTYVEKAELVRDRRPFGSVYRAAVRVRADPATMDTLARRFCDALDGRERNLRGAFFSSLVLVALAFSAFLVYVFIRAGNTGGWKLPLRFVSGGMLLGVLGALAYIAMNLGAS